MVSTVPIALQIPWQQVAKIFPASGINFILAAAAGTTNGNTAPTKVIGVVVCNNDSIDHDVQLSIATPSASYFLGTVVVPTGAGCFGTIPAVNLFNTIPVPLDETGQGYIFLNVGNTLQVRVTTAVNTGKEIDVIVFGADF